MKTSEYVATVVMIWFLGFVFVNTCLPQDRIITSHIQTTNGSFALNVDARGDGARYMQAINASDTQGGLSHVFNGGVQTSLLSEGSWAFTRAQEKLGQSDYENGIGEAVGSSFRGISVARETMGGGGESGLNYSAIMSGHGDMLGGHGLIDCDGDFQRYHMGASGQVDAWEFNVETIDIPGAEIDLPGDFLDDIPSLCATDLNPWRMRIEGEE